MTFLKMSINRNRTAPRFHSEELIKLIWRNQGPRGSILSVKIPTGAGKMRCWPRTRHSSHGDAPLSSTRRNLLWGVQLADSPHCKQCTQDLGQHHVLSEHSGGSRTWQFLPSTGFLQQILTGLNETFSVTVSLRILQANPPFFPHSIYTGQTHIIIWRFPLPTPIPSPLLSFMGLTPPLQKKIFCSLILSLSLPPVGPKLT